MLGRELQKEEGKGKRLYSMSSWREERTGEIMISLEWHGIWSKVILCSLISQRCKFMIVFDKKREITMISKFNRQWRKYWFTIDQQYCICYRAKFGFIPNYFAYYASLKRKSKKKKCNIICTYNIEITNKWQKKEEILISLVRGCTSVV